MYRIFLNLLVIFVFSISTVFANSLFKSKDFDPEDSNKFTVIFKTFKPSRIYGTINGDPNAQNANKVDYGFGASVNFLTFEYSPIFTDGERYSLYYTFLNGSPVNPYLGFSYIRNTDIYDKPTKSKVDGFDGILGVEVSYLKYIVPYFEYAPVSSLWIFGVRFKLGVVVDKRDAPHLDADQQKQISSDYNKSNISKSSLNNANPSSQKLGKQQATSSR